MREATMATLYEWISRSEEQDSAGSDFEGRDYFLDDDLQGVSKFLKEVAYKLDDIEMLGLASKVELYLKGKAKDEDEYECEQHATWQKGYQFDQQVREICIQLFYKDPMFVVDMSKYKAMVEASQDHFTDKAKLSTLLRYIDEKVVLDKIYGRVKDRFRYRFSMSDELPTAEDVAKAYDEELAKVHRLADAHVVNVLARHTAE